MGMAVEAQGPWLGLLRSVAIWLATGWCLLTSQGGKPTREAGSNSISCLLQSNCEKELDQRRDTALTVTPSFLWVLMFPGWPKHVSCVRGGGGQNFLSSAFTENKWEGGVLFEIQLSSLLRFWNYWTRWTAVLRDWRRPLILFRFGSF